MVLKVAAVQSIKDYKRDSQQSKEGSTRKKPTTFADILKKALTK